MKEAFRAVVSLDCVKQHWKWLVACFVVGVLDVIVTDIGLSQGLTEASPMADTSKMIMYPVRMILPVVLMAALLFVRLSVLVKAVVLYELAVVINNALLLEGINVLNFSADKVYYYLQSAAIIAAAMVCLVVARRFRFPAGR